MFLPRGSGEGVVRHVGAETVREVGWVDPGFGPAADAVCDAKGDGGGLWGGAHGGDEEGVLPAVGAGGGFVGGVLVGEAQGGRAGIEGVSVPAGVVGLVFATVGGGEAVGEGCFGGVCRGVESTLLLFLWT